MPSTKADDGDPIDIMVVHDAATFPGIVLTCRVIGILQIEQKSKGKSERNDRLFAVPKDSHSEQALKDVSDLSKPIREELEKFFKATDELEDKKLNIIAKLRTRRSAEALWRSAWRAARQFRFIGPRPEPPHHRWPVAVSSTAKKESGPRRANLRNVMEVTF